MQPENTARVALPALNTAIIHCHHCPRLVHYRQAVAQEKRRAYQDEAYWGRAVPGWGNPNARLLVLGLAPGAHGANRTGLPFSGDSSGHVLLPALARAGFATHRPDLDLPLSRQYWPQDVYITNAVRCVPPGNRPDAQERRNCEPYLLEEIRLLSELSVVLALGKLAFDAALAAFEALDEAHYQPRPKFAHGLQLAAGRYTLLCSYHPSRRNTQTGLLTAAMLDSVLADCSALLGNSP